MAQEHLQGHRLKICEYFISSSECAGNFKGTQVRVREHITTSREDAGTLKITHMQKHITTFSEGV